MDYRKPSKPKPSAKQIRGWPWSEPKPYKGQPSPLLDSEMEGLMSDFNTRERNAKFMTNMFVIVAIVLVFAALMGVLFGISVADENEREECRRSGGHVVEVHGARPSGITTPWMCQR